MAAARRHQTLGREVTRPTGLAISGSHTSFRSATQGWTVGGAGYPEGV
jgi:hypothetical protein